MNPSTDPVLQHNPQPWQEVNSSVELYVAGAGDEISAAMDEQMARDRENMVGEAGQGTLWLMHGAHWRGGGGVG